MSKTNSIRAAVSIQYRHVCVLPAAEMQSDPREALLYVRRAVHKDGRST